MGNEQAILEPGARFTVEQFLSFSDAPSFRELGRIELIDGEAIVAVPTSIAHGRALAELATATVVSLRQAGVTHEALVRVSARLGEDSLPDVDLVIAAPSNDDFVTPATARLFVEVADDTLDLDLGRKQRLYARSGVPEYWVVDVTERTITRLHHPEGEAYRDRAEIAFGEPVIAATIDGLIVDTSRLA